MQYENYNVSLPVRDVDRYVITRKLLDYIFDVFV
jgi:hypothetical protein